MCTLELKILTTEIYVPERDSSNTLQLYTIHSKYNDCNAKVIYKNLYYFQYSNNHLEHLLPIAYLCKCKKVPYPDMEVKLFEL